MLEKIKNLRHKNVNIVTFLLIAIAVIVAYKVIMNIEEVVHALYRVARYMKGLLMPFIIGALIAYVINPAVTFFEKNVFGRFKKLNRKKTLLSLIVVYALAAATLILVFNMLIPLLIKSITDIVVHIPEYFNTLLEFRNGEWNDSVIGRILFNVIATVETELVEFLGNYDIASLNPAITDLVNGVMNATGTVLDVVFGLIISIYFILDKQKLLSSTKRFCRAFLKDESFNKFSSFALESHGIFSRFIAGKTLDSLIIGCLCIIGLKILGVNNSALYGVIVGVTNMIPYFGPIIGAVPVVLLVLFESPLKALWVGLFIFALQQFDGMILGPKILGDSINLRPFWIIFAIIVGGGLFGVVGMFLGAPALAVILLATNRFIDRRIKDKENIIEETPIEQ